jgi:hypothetical protein
MYKLFADQTISNCVIRISDNAIIPCDPDNTDYQEYLKWLDGYEMQGLHWVKTSDGNTPLPADPVE